MTVKLKAGHFHRFTAASESDSSNQTAAMVNLFDGIIKSLERKKKTCCLFIDLKKAFDCVNHIIVS
jgi:hypothetical protein